jgi:hypothetical protein
MVLIGKWGHINAGPIRPASLSQSGRWDDHKAGPTTISVPAWLPPAANAHLSHPPCDYQLPLRTILGNATSGNDQDRETTR